jgi:predicted phage tail protein
MALPARTLAVALLLTAAACGSDSPSGPAPSPTPAPTPARTVVATKGLTIPGGTTASETVDNVPAGTVDVRLDWADPGVDLNLYVSDTNCSSIVDLLANACRVLGQATGAARPEVVTFTATTTGNYVVWARNVGSATQAAMVEVGVTR